MSNICLCIELVCKVIVSFLCCKCFRDRTSPKKTTKRTKRKYSTTRRTEIKRDLKTTSKLVKEDLLNKYRIILPNDEFESSEQFFRSKNYEISNETLGSGAFGSVLKATKFGPEGKREDIAVKVMDIETKKTLDSLVNEFYTIEIVVSQTMRLRQEHVIKVYNWWIIDVIDTNTKTSLYTKAYMFMELSTDGNLEEEMERVGPLENSIARRYFSHLVYAIDFLHYNRVAHRDIKLSNLLLFKDKRIPTKKILKLTDFSLSRIHYTDEGYTALTRVGGTRPYKAPEIILREIDSRAKPVDPYKADIFAMGVCLFQMLTNQFPFPQPETDPPTDIDKKWHLERQQNKEYHFPDKNKYPINNLAKDLVGRLLEPEPNKRLRINVVKKHKWLETEITLSLTMTN